METKTIQISAGKGPAECEYVVAKVLRIFLLELINNKIDYTILNRETGIENGTIQSVSIQLNGNQLAEFLQHWFGTIQWIGTSTFRKFHKRKNWFIGCFEVDISSAISIKENEIQFQAIRSSGAGGQHVNKVNSAIRAKHIQTGLQVLVMDSRSQHQNKKIAIKRLHEKVASFNLDQANEQLKNQWENHQELERGNPIRVFTGIDFKQIKKSKSFKTKRNQLKNDLRKQLE
ncbi:peptide chain release factor H [Polaribacter sargassicola]|uniref:peptide chain release factor H n=1 Tax=Polaribacter sargassicola TaxID=2836891 RepID=UPI001F02A5C8|nr:peptide chain release factor H [Polaribacter sp. DS7-9]MCG1035044.1 peptide chain release factor H [Polaribacter sp. DS7-9]